MADKSATGSILYLRKKTIHGDILKYYHESSAAVRLYNNTSVLLAARPAANRRIPRTVIDMHNPKTNHPRPYTKKPLLSRGWLVAHTRQKSNLLLTKASCTQH